MIKCLLYENVRDEQYFFLTGGADRTVKIWETDLKNKGIIQTLAGHAGTILDMKYSPITQVLVTCSSDKTLKIWR